MDCSKGMGMVDEDGKIEVVDEYREMRMLD